MGARSILFILPFVLIFSLLSFTSAYSLTPREYDQTVPYYMQTFYQGTMGPEYRGAWFTLTEGLGQDKNLPAGYIPSATQRTSIVGRSNSTNYQTDFGYWSAPTGMPDVMRVGSFSLTNDVESWYSPPAGATRAILYSVIQDYTAVGGPNNTDIMYIDQYQVETMFKHGYLMGEYETYAVPDSLGIEDRKETDKRDTALTDFDYEPTVPAHRLWYDHSNALNWSTVYYGIPRQLWMQGSSNVYFGTGKTGKFDDDTGELLYGGHNYMTWGTTSGSGYASAPRANYNGSEILIGNITLRSGRWESSVFVGGVTYRLYMSNSGGTVKPYDAAKYPEDPENPGDMDAASGYPIQWFDDYALQTTYGLSLGVTTRGVSGRWVIARSQAVRVLVPQAPAHEGDIMADVRTYNPIGNADGPKSQYEWLYDASGNMYVPTGSPPTGGWSADPYDRAFELIGKHPAFPNDDTYGEMDSIMPTNYDSQVGRNYNDGSVSQVYFEYAWKIAGKMLGDRFWESGYIWSNTLGAVATRVYTPQTWTKTANLTMLPVMIKNTVDKTWYFPTMVTQDGQPKWCFADTYTDVAVAGFAQINDFMRYVMEIDALTVQDTNGNGIYDEAEDYILFSLVDDGRFTKMLLWGETPTTMTVPAKTPFAGQYFSGETIFLYHNCNVITYFDPGTGTFFGSSIGTAYGATLWSMFGAYDINAMDILLIPEPATMFLVLGAALALGSSIVRKRIR